MSFNNFTSPGNQNLNYSMGSPGGFSGCHLKFIDKGVFRCNKAYIKLISINNERMTLKEDGPCPGFNYSGFIPKDFCAGGIEIGYDISWGMDWPLQERFVHGNPFKGTIIDLNSLTIKISGTTFYPHFYILDGAGHKIEYSL